MEKGKIQIRSSHWGWRLNAEDNGVIVLASCNEFCENSTVTVEWTILTPAKTFSTQFVPTQGGDINLTGPFKLKSFVEVLPHDDSVQDVSGERIFPTVRERMLSLFEEQL